MSTPSFGGSGESGDDCETNELTALAITMIVVAFVFMMTTALLLQHLIRQKPSREDFPEIIVTSIEQQDDETP